MEFEEVIFAPLPQSGKVAVPTPQALNEFLERTSKDSVAETHIADVIRYRKPLYHVENFERRMQSVEARPSASERAVFGVLLHTRFFNRPLLLALGTYKYHLRELAAIDFAGPSRFIESAEITMKKLGKRKINDVLRLGRLQDMVAERKEMLTRRESRWADLSAELLDIALYVLENIVKIERLCGRSIAMLRPEIAGRKERQILESIKGMLKNQLADALRYRTVTTEDVGRARQEVDVLAGELRERTDEDMRLMTSIYEAVRGHVKRCAGELDDLLEDFRGKKIEMDREQSLRFRRIEQSLVSLVSAYPEDLDLTGARPGAARSFIIEEKRQEMITYLLEEVRKGPRARIDRRAKQERRKKEDPHYAGPERRTGRDRRK